MALYDPERLRCDQTAAWAALQTHFYGTGRDFDLRDAFASDPGRFAAFSLQAPHVFADLSKNLVDAPTQALLLALADECGLAQHRDAMFAGEAINTTEQRAGDALAVARSRRASPRRHCASALQKA
jgi:glucose-6-phosphate isomerase